LEDLDEPRVVEGMAAAAEYDLKWLGLDWDEGPDCGGDFGPYIQSERSAYYEAALKRLLKKGRLFPCKYSRKDLESLSSAPHGPEKGAPYPAYLRPNAVEDGWYERLHQKKRPDASVRFLVSDESVRFVDRLNGPVTELVTDTVGDFVVKRKDGVYAYQLAVVVDDIAMQITEVVRGMDLIDSTARQIQLIQALDGAVPAYGHVPLVYNAQGEKLSKRDAGLTLASLREAGVRPEQLVGYLAYSLGLQETPEAATMHDVLEIFDWGQLQKTVWILPDELVSVLGHL
jgi:glutamyl-tRNA synthetase